MNVTILGGAGFVGSVLVRELLARDYTVTVLDNLLYRQDSLATCALNPKFKFHRVDVRDNDALRPHLTDADIIIPLADLVGAPICALNPIDAELVNLTSKLDLLKMLSKEQCVIAPTTESVYGKNDKVCTEETPINPLSTYAKHKAIVESALMERGNAISLRPATAYGVSQRMRLDLLVNDFTWRALKDRAMVVFEGRFRRTVVHVRDLASAFIHAIENFETMKNQIYNVGAESVSKLELCAEIQKQIPKHSPLDPGFSFVEVETGRDADQRDYVVSEAKLEATGYRPRITLQQGISELLLAYRMLSASQYSNVP